MDILKLETKLQDLVTNISNTDFIFDFLLAYELPKSTIARLKKDSDVNTLNINGELLVKNKKLFFKASQTENLDADLVQLQVEKNLCVLSL